MLDNRECAIKKLGWINPPPRVSEKDWLKFRGVNQQSVSYDDYVSRDRRTRELSTRFNRPLYPDKEVWIHSFEFVDGFKKPSIYRCWVSEERQELFDNTSREIINEMISLWYPNK